MEQTVAGRTLAPILQLQGVTRSFRQGPREIVVLQGVDVALWPGQAVALVGPSGAGKSTLLHITGLLELPTSGRVIVNGRDCATLSESERTRLRRTEIGFVYQFHQLLPEFSALENVVIPQLILGRAEKLRKRGRGHFLPTSGSATGSNIARRNFQAANSSGPPSAAASPTRRSCCSPTSRPEISIRTRPRTFSAS